MKTIKISLPENLLKIIKENNVDLNDYFLKFLVDNISMYSDGVVEKAVKIYLEKLNINKRYWKEIISLIKKNKDKIYFGSSLIASSIYLISKKYGLGITQEKIWKVMNVSPQTIRRVVKLLK